MSTIIDRIGEFASTCHLSIRKIEQKIGASNGTISKAIGKDKDIQTRWLEMFVIHFPEVNPVWLMTGKGDMILAKAENQESNILLKESEPPYGLIEKSQHQEVVNSLKLVIATLENQLNEKERIISLKDRIINELEKKQNN
ncbi:MAG: hypothetical protein ACXIU2_09265 [Cyclobacteriaceae bacterium]